MDNSQKQKKAPRQVYVPVHRRREIEAETNTATSFSSKNSEKKSNENAPVKRKGRGQFKAPEFDSHDEKDSIDTQKQNEENVSRIEEESKGTEKIEKFQNEDVDEIASKIQELNLNSKDDSKNTEVRDICKEQNLQESKHNPNNRKTKGRDPNRPATSDMVARRLIHGALGIRVVRTPEQRQADKDLLQEAREKRQAEKGTLNKKNSAVNPSNEEV